MKKLTSFLICIIFLCIISSCGKKENSSEDIDEDIASSSQMETESQTEENTTEETTTEWVNPYAENHRIVSEQIMEWEIDWMADYDLNSLVEMYQTFEYDKRRNKEACFAVVTLIKVSGETGDLENGTSDNVKTPIDIKIEKVLESSENQNAFKEGLEIKTYDRTIWKLSDDGTYKVKFPPKRLPIVEVGSRYVVYLVKEAEEVKVTCITLPFDINGCYIDTVATGRDTYKNISDEILWYYDINSTYYYDYWENRAYDRELFKERGFDVFDKKFPFWAADGIVY